MSIFGRNYVLEAAQAKVKNNFSNESELRKSLIKSIKPLNENWNNKLGTSDRGTLLDQAYQEWSSWLKETTLNETEKKALAKYSFARFVDRLVLIQVGSENKIKREIAEIFLFRRYKKLFYKNDRFILGLNDHQNETAFNTAFYSIIQLYAKNIKESDLRFDLAAIFKKTYMRQLNKMRIRNNKLNKTSGPSIDELVSLQLEEKIGQILNERIEEKMGETRFTLAYEKLKNENVNCYRLLKQREIGYQNVEIADWYGKTANSINIQFTRCISLFKKIYENVISSTYE